MGTSIRATGRRSLYITWDGETATMGKATPSVQYAYRDFLLPQGTYNISFDWVCLGDTSLGVRAEMYAGQVGTTVPLTASTNTAGLPVAVRAGLKVGSGSTFEAKERPDGGKRMAGVRTWQSAGFQVQSNGTRVTRVFFAWRNNVTSAGADTLKAAIAC